MFGLSIFEILFLAGLALIVIGPKELPQVARTIGRFLNELKRTTNGFAHELREQARVDRVEPYENHHPPQQPVEEKPPEATHSESTKETEPNSTNPSKSEDGKS